MIKDSCTKKLNLTKLWNFSYKNKFHFLDCGTPPEIENGTVSYSKDNILQGTILNYTCNQGHFAHGVNFDKLSTECLKSGNYSLSNESLATCAPIC